VFNSAYVVSRRDIRWKIFGSRRCREFVVHVITFPVTCNWLRSWWRITKAFLWWARVMNAAFSTTCRLRPVTSCRPLCWSSWHQMWSSRTAWPAECFLCLTSLILMLYRCVLFVWNSLPVELRCLPAYSSFCSRLKTFLFAKFCSWYCTVKLRYNGLLVTGLKVP